MLFILISHPHPLRSSVRISELKVFVLQNLDLIAPLCQGPQHLKGALKCIYVVGEMQDKFKFIESIYFACKIEQIKPLWLISLQIFATYNFQILYYHRP